MWVYQTLCLLGNSALVAYAGTRSTKVSRVGFLTCDPQRRLVISTAAMRAFSQASCEDRGIHLACDASDFDFNPDIAGVGVSYIWILSTSQLIVGG